jgi:4-hydroxybenzoate polyprenyltransferase
MQWIAYVGMMMFFLLPIQELRDVQGDKILGRKTIPIMLGENVTRIVIPIVCSVMPIFMYYVFHFSATPLLPSYGFPLDHLYVLVMTLWLWLLAYRVYVYRTKVQDHNSYLLLSWWYVAILGGTIVLGG